MPTAPDTSSPPPAAVLTRSVVLVGLMGAGKTSVGRLLAARIGLEFVDADAEIETAAGSTIEEIFAHEGEAVFRSGERRVIARLLTGPPRVIATGGGAFMDAETRAEVRAHAVSVWLRADLDTLVRRTARRGGRPLLAEGDPRDILARLMAERYPVYGEADITVDTGEEGADKVVERVIAALESHFGTGPLAAPRQSGNGKGNEGKTAARPRPRRRK
jgi:shikimate kinase